VLLFDSQHKSAITSQSIKATGYFIDKLIVLQSLPVSGCVKFNSFLHRIIRIRHYQVVLHIAG